MFEELGLSVDWKNSSVIIVPKQNALFSTKNIQSQYPLHQRKKLSQTKPLKNPNGAKEKVYIPAFTDLFC